MEAILAIDGGATHTRCFAIDQSGRRLAQAQGGPSNHLHEPERVIRARLAGLIEQTLQLAKLRQEDVACLSAGLAGVDFDGYGAEPMLALFRELGFERCLIYGDVVIAHAAALDAGPGIVVLAGTGSSILGINASGYRARVGGWGGVYGNEASAQWISKHALRAAACAYDGRGPSTMLLDALMQSLGVSDFRESISLIYGPQARDIASLCEVVYRCAVSGDPVARSLFHDAAAELVEGIIAAACRLGLESSPIAVSYQGGVAEHCPILIAEMRESLREALPQARVQAPLWKPVMGAYLLACNAMGWKAAMQ
jgi:N-acetylglucosamine kinase-like BadF-type ATPase